MRRSVADAICAALTDEGVTDVFGLPGSQTIDLWEALRRSPLRTTVPTSELSASFMAVGYALATGRPGVLATIGGPGFGFAFPGIVESRLDSVPLLHLASASSAVGPGSSGVLRQRDVARLVAKEVVEPVEAEHVGAVVREALRVASGGEPGPVIVQLAPDLLRARAGAQAQDAAAAPSADRDTVTKVVGELRAAERPLLFFGAGVADASADVVRLAEGICAPVLTTTSARGVIPETHALCITRDVVGGAIEALNDLVASCDLVLVLGAKLSENATRSRRLRLPADHTVRVDASEDILRSGEPTRVALVADVPALLRAVADELASDPGPPRWSETEIAEWGRRLDAESAPALAEPELGGLRSEGALLQASDGDPARAPRHHGLRAPPVPRAGAPSRARAEDVARPDELPVDGLRHPGRDRSGDRHPRASRRDRRRRRIHDQRLRAAHGGACESLAHGDRRRRRTARPDPGAAASADGPVVRHGRCRAGPRAVRARGRRGLRRASQRRRGTAARGLTDGRVTVVELPATDTGAVRRAQARGLALSTVRRLAGPRLRARHRRDPDGR